MCNMFSTRLFSIPYFSTYGCNNCWLYTPPWNKKASPLTFFMQLLHKLNKKYRTNEKQVQNWIIFVLHITVFEMNLPSRYFIVQKQHWKCQRNVWNMFKVNNKGTRTTSLLSFWVFNVNFEQISHIVLCFYCWTWTNICYLG